MSGTSGVRRRKKRAKPILVVVAARGLRVLVKEGLSFQVDREGWGWRSNEGGSEEAEPDDGYQFYIPLSPSTSYGSTSSKIGLALSN